MKINNVHERTLGIPAKEAGRAIDRLAGPGDILWPGYRWPAMQLDSPLGEGAAGGHGPVRYAVAEYIPGRRVVFGFSEEGVMAGLDGRHYFEVVPRRNNVLLRHVVEGECGFKTWLLWLLVVGPCHDALMEDALDLAENSLTGGRRSTRLGIRVRMLRRMIARRARKPETSAA